jgi:signal peptidase I
MRTFATTALVVALTAAAWMLWPASLGGRTTYVITHGVSMEPGFHSGDLAILHSATSYRVGEVAAYHSDTLHTLVMHRIQAVDSTRAFVFKGDNNGWLDPDHPAATKLVGHLYLRVPAGGRYLHLAHSPWVLGILGALMIGTGSAKAHRRKRRRARRAKTRPVPSAPAIPTSRQAAVAAVAVAVAVTVAAGYLWSVPARTAGTRTVSVTHAPALTYDGTARRGATYPDGLVHTGQPVYLRLVHQITVRLTDPLSATDLLGPVNTTAAITVTLSTPAGWTTTLDALAATDLRRGPATVILDLPAALRQLQAVAAETGVGQPAGTLTIAAHLVSRTSTAGHPINSTADTAYAFALDPTELRPTTNTAPAATTPSMTSANAATTLVSTVKLPTLTPTTIAIRGHRMPLGLLRLLLTLLAAACSLVAAGMMLALRSTDGAAARTRRSFGHRLLEVTSLDPNDHLVTVATPAALLRIADRYERLVLHLPGEHGDTYAVHDDGISYRYTDAPTRTTVRHLWSAA